MQENNRYREEEKELEEKNEVENENLEKTEVEEDEVETEKDEIEQELKKDSKQIKKLKKRNNQLETEVKELTDQVAFLKDQLLRNQAELENFKRRTNEERIRERKYAMQDFFSEIISVIDTFDRVVSAKTDDEKLKKYLTGFVMINNKPFDPAYHQAIEVVEVEGVEPNIVVEVIAEGYLYKDRVLRPSMVKVSK